MKSLMQTITMWISVLLALFFISTGANAQGTPDWQTPSMETVCDAESAPGRGLCIAFCEAMDCDDDPYANQNACNGVKQKWQNKTGKTNLPCEISCPCNDIAGYQLISNGAVAIGACVDQQSINAISLVTVAGTIAAAISNPSITFGCGYFSGTGFLNLPASEEEATFCMDELRAQAEAQGVDCSIQ
jgi:hypothetical protein